MQVIHWLKYQLRVLGSLENGLRPERKLTGIIKGDIIPKGS